MANPYESPNISSGEDNASPRWYVWFYKAYWPVWWIGTALIACSWLDIVTRTAGWVGFGMAGAATLGAYVLPTLAGIKPVDCVFLDSRLLKTKGAAYHNAMARFRNGASLMYDGVAFGFQPNNEIACAIVADSTNLDATAVLELAAHAQAIFDTLSAESLEFTSAVSGRQFRISIVSGTGEDSHEICRVINGKINWLQ